MFLKSSFVQILFIHFEHSWSVVQVLVEYDGLWRDYDSNVEKLLQWIEYKKLVIMRLHSGCGHLIGVRQGLAELKALETELEEMCAQFEAVHQLGDKLLGKHNHVTSLVVTENETRLYKAKNYLTSQILQLRFENSSILAVFIFDIVSEFGVTVK